MKRSGRRRSNGRRNADRKQRLNLRAGAISARLDRIDLAGKHRAGPSGHSRACHLSLSFWGAVPARVLPVVLSARTGRAMRCASSMKVKYICSSRCIARICSDLRQQLRVLRSCTAAEAVHYCHLSSRGVHTKAGESSHIRAPALSRSCYLRSLFRGRPRDDVGVRIMPRFAICIYYLQRH